VVTTTAAGVVTPEVVGVRRRVEFDVRSEASDEMVDVVVVVVVLVGVTRSVVGTVELKSTGTGDGLVVVVVCAGVTRIAVELAAGVTRAVALVVLSDVEMADDGVMRIVLAGVVRTVVLSS
jgi:hypothetical protein